jgi:hypothetical protein
VVIAIQGVELNGQAYKHLVHSLDRNKYDAPGVAPGGDGEGDGDFIEGGEAVGDFKGDGEGVGDLGRTVGDFLGGGPAAITS